MICFNDSFGQSWRSSRRAPDSVLPASLTRLNLIFERLLTEPETRDPLLVRFRALLDGPWSAPAINETIDAWAAEVRDAALRDERRWGAAYAEYFSERTDLTTFEQEVDYLRTWVVARHDFVRNVHLEQPFIIIPAATPDPSSPIDPSSPDETGSPDASGSPDGAGSPDELGLSGAPGSPDIPGSPDEPGSPDKPPPMAPPATKDR